jgi:hypothetical protein
MRWQPLLAVTGVAILGAAAAMLWSRPTAALVAEVDCDHLHLNMTEEEIEVALGRSADYRGRANHRRILGQNIARGWSARDDSAAISHESLWHTDHGGLWVQFDADGRARVLVHSVPLEYEEVVRRTIASLLRLLRTIVATIDRYGLKKRHLHKHSDDVERFFRTLGGRNFHSDLAQAYQQRLMKNREKLFTFLRHDSVPWNNNNAEHAFKHYAHYREVTDGQMTESGISDYLVLLSLYQTCKYKGVSFLKFLASFIVSANSPLSGPLFFQPGLG